MRLRTLPLLLTALLLAGLLILPGPTGPTRPAVATHEGDISCPSNAEPLHDGVVQREEYGENFFDPKTKILLHFECSQDARRMMHVGVISPWDGWTEIRFQANDQWNGDFNVVRVSASESPAVALDGFVNGTEGLFMDDLAVGGSFDVTGLAGGRTEEAYVYEFAFPLLSSDIYDSRLTLNGSFYFQLAALAGESTIIESEPQFLQIGQEPPEGKWTLMELSLPQLNNPLVPSEILVTLRDHHSRPLALMPISAFVQTNFGFLDLGTFYTNAEGVASAEYAPRDEGTYLIGAAFEGEHSHLASVAWHPLVIAPGPSEQTFLPQDLLFVQTLVVVVVGAVWGVFGYALFIVYQALRAEEKPPLGAPKRRWRFPLPRSRSK